MSSANNLALASLAFFVLVSFLIRLANRCFDVVLSATAVQYITMSANTDAETTADTTDSKCSLISFKIQNKANIVIKFSRAAFVKNTT